MNNKKSNKKKVYRKKKSNKSNKSNKSKIKGGGTPPPQQNVSNASKIDTTGEDGKIKIYHGSESFNLQCRVCGHSEFDYRVTKIPTDANFFFRETAEFFEDKAFLFTCRRCRNIQWFSYDISADDSGSRSKLRKENSGCTIS